MTSITRRAFIAWTAALLPAAVLARYASAAPINALPADTLDPELLRALGLVVLPSELGADASARVIAGFRRWTEGYRAGAELLHGYGSPDIRHAGPSPAPRWAAQLRALDTEARARHGTGFAKVTAEQRRALVRAQLANDKNARMPSVGGARHVAAALMAYFYTSPGATDLCYGVAIGRNGCRPLATSPQRPVPLERRT